MIFAILACVSLVTLGVSWFLYLRNLELFLCLLIIINFEFFFLLPKFVGYQYLLLPMIFILLFVNYLSGKLSFGRYGWWVICFIVISIFGIFVAYQEGQGFSLGIKAAKFIPLVLVYFLLAGRQINVEKFSNYFIIMSLAVAFLATISSFTHGAINFFPGIPRDMLVDQFGRLRITSGSFVISAASVMAFARYQQSSFIRFLYASAALFGEVVVVSQTRAAITAIVLSMFVVYVLSHKLTTLRVAFYLILSGLFMIAFLVLQHSDLSGVEFVKRTETDLAKRGGSYGGSLQARLNAYDYYWKEMQKHLITGRGMINFNWEEDKEKKLQEYYGIHLSDIGIVHFLVQAGLIGFVWLLYGLFRLWKDIFLFRGYLCIACYFMIGTFTMPTIDMFLRVEDSMFLFAVFLGLFSSMIMNVKPGVVPAGA